MTISSRTPEGNPGRCPVCAAEVTVAPAEPPGDAPCPQCGTLLWPLGGFADLFLFPGTALSADNRDYLAEFCRRLGARPADRSIVSRHCWSLKRDSI